MIPEARPAPYQHSAERRARVCMDIAGAVQGVGYRPFVFRLAASLALTGWVRNSSQGVSIEAEGTQSQLEQFCRRIQTEKPPAASIRDMKSAFLDPIGYADFTIRPSDEGGIKTAVIMADIATCAECLHELFSPTNRRYRYPFINCAHCGPRYSIIEALPYDRRYTTMKPFIMCDPCRAEYENPRDRRFHAQPNACPACGPLIELWDRGGNRLAARDRALAAAAEAIRHGAVVAVKGLGGFHLMVDARNERAISDLRRRKRRPEKPFAVMVPSLESVKAYCEVSVVEERLLRSPEAPIVLLRRATGPPIGLAADPGSIRELIRPKDGATKSDNDAGEFIAGCNCMHTSWERRLPAGTSAIPRNSLCRQDAGAPRGALALSGDQFPAGSVAPGNPYLGIMLPYAPLHHLLMADLNFPIVATSGNRAEEPICTKEKEALAVLGDLADLFLIHNRPIARPVDDSLARVMMGRELVLRRARGYAPLPIPIKPTAAVALAVGAHLKNTVAVSRGQEIVASQHIGDMATPRAWEVFQEAIHSFTSLYNLNYASVMCDAHPDYRTALFAKQSGQPVQKVQHHFAHVLSGMADNGLEDSVLGVAWDGAGYGLDGTLWGCEFLYVTNNAFHRVAHLRPFRLPGGEKAIHEPRRSALGLLYEIMGEGLFEKSDHLRRSDLYPPLRSFSPSERQALHVVLRRAINAPLTTSAGRLFDAVASLVNLRQVATFEGQAAMELEFACDGMTVNESYEFEMSQAGAVDGSSPLVINWAPTVLSIVKDCRADESIGKISARFHNTLVEIIVAVARRIRQARVLLTGGCFQNKYLTERAIARLRAEGFLPFWHQRVPPNDGGIAVGQALAAARQSLAE